MFSLPPLCFQYLCQKIVSSNHRTPQETLWSLKEEFLSYEWKGGDILKKWVKILQAARIPEVN